MRQDNYAALVMVANQTIWGGIAALEALQREWTALDYTNTWTSAVANVAELSAVVNTTCDALTALLAAGHATNMAKLLP